MDIGKYIHELLLENDIVTIPGLGAFVSEYKPAEFSHENDEIKPPSKIVSFNQQIKNNDGLLVGLVAEKKRMSHFDALKKIEKEREDILYKLDNGEQVEIVEVGILFYTEEHHIGFKAYHDENLLLDSFGLESTSIAREEETAEEEPSLVPPVSEDKETKEPVEEVIPRGTSSEEETAKEVTPTEVQKTKPQPVIKTPSGEIQKEKKKRGWLWLLLVLIPLIAVSVFLLTQEKNDKAADTPEVMESEPKYIEEPVGIEQDTAKTDSVKIVAKDTVEPEEVKTEPEINTDPNTPKYYLVGGSFAIEENAETYLKELRDKGFDAFHVGKKGRFFIIGIGTYNTFNEAEKAKQEYMVNNPGSEVWVYKK